MEVKRQSDGHSDPSLTIDDWYEGNNISFTPSLLPRWSDADQSTQHLLREFLYRYAPADSVKRDKFERDLCELLNNVKNQTNEQRTTQADR